MAGIIEIWRKNHGLNLPIKFTVEQQPVMENGSILVDSPAVSRIDFFETGSLAGKRANEPLFRISFDETLVQRFIKARDVIDIAYESDKPQGTKTPELED